jgi:hypothetical protein
MASRQKSKRSAAPTRAADLIKCLEDVENRLSKFLKKKDAEGKIILIDGVAKLGADPDKAIEILKDAFKTVVDPILLKNFDGTWMAFLLWNDFAGRVQVLYNYSTTRKRAEYEFVSRFVNSKAFSRKFSEPMTDIIFTERTAEKHVMVFSWGAQPKGRELANITAVPRNIRPVLVAFDNLGGRWRGRFKAVREFVDTAAARNYGEADFVKLAEIISDLANKLLERKEVRDIVLKARRTIYRKFGFTVRKDQDLIDEKALCRTLIWNRLFDMQWNYLYYIPAKFLSGSAVSGIVCAFTEILPPHDYIVLTQIVNRIFSLFHFGSYGQQLNLFALRSATAAIMARNKSHIHGSHIEHGLRNKMENFTDIIGARLTSDEPFYRSLRDSLGILDDSDPKAALGVRIEFIEELAQKLKQAKDSGTEIKELEYHKRDLTLLEDINEWLDQLPKESLS